jgi:hypothetical protein
MIRFPWFTLIGALTCLLCLWITAFARVQFDIRLSVQQSSFSVGTDIPVEITLTNISNEVLEVTYTRVPAVDFIPIVLRSNGSGTSYEGG